MNEPLGNYLVVGAILFALGALGFLTRRSLILMMLSAELMLHGVSLNLVAFSEAHQNFQGQAFTIFVLTVAACEAGLSLSLILVLYQRHKSLDIAKWQQLGEPHQKLPATAVAPRLEAEEAVEPPMPRLTPAGRQPALEPEESIARV